MISAQTAKKHANGHLRSSGSHLVATSASRNKRYGVWVVAYHDPDNPAEVLLGGALVVTDSGAVHDIGSTPDAVDLLMAREYFSGENEAPARERGSVTADGSRAEVSLAPSSLIRLPWPGVLDHELAEPYFSEVMRFIACERDAGAVYPSANSLFAAFHLTAYEDVKVVLLGQDPYHQPGQANGLCFSVPRDVRRLPPSLRNIHAAMARDGYEPPLHGDLTDWARQGVLLLNASLSVRASEPNSHASVWSRFTDSVISKLSEREQPIVFVLWGRWALRKRGMIDEDRHRVVTAPHPAARGRFQTEFRNAVTFAEVNRQLDDLKAAPINWSVA